MPARGPLHAETNVRALDVRFRKFRSLQALYFLLAGSDLRRPGSRRESRNEFVELSDLFLALGIAGFNADARLSLGEHHIVIPARVCDDGLIVDVSGVRADVI